MNERLTLSIFGRSLAVLIVAMFVLNALALTS